MSEPTQLIRRPVFEMERTQKIDLQKPLWMEIKRIYCNEATEAEFMVLCRMIEATNLDIFNREVFWIPKIGSYISHKGYWALAMRSEVWDGFEPHQFWYKDKNGKLNQERRGDLYSVKATGWRKDMRFPVIFEALWEEWEKCKSERMDYKTGKIVVKENPNWTGRPEHMLTVKAERGVLFRAFPVSGAMEGYGVDEDSIPAVVTHSETVPLITSGLRSIEENEKLLKESKIPSLHVPPTVSTGSVEQEAEEVLQPPTPTPPAPQKPVNFFSVPERARQEIFQLINKIMELRLPEMTHAKLFQIGFADSSSSSETLTQCKDIDLLNKVYLRLNDLNKKA